MKVTELTLDQIARAPNLDRWLVAAAVAFAAITSACNSESAPNDGHGASDSALRRCDPETGVCDWADPVDEDNAADLSASQRVDAPPLEVPPPPNDDWRGALYDNRRRCRVDQEC